MKLVVGMGAALLSLAGCSSAYMAHQAFPDRVMYAFDTKLVEGRLGYSCEKGPSEADTIARANKAHRAFENAVIDFSEAQSEAMIAGMRAGKSTSGLTADLDRSGDTWAEETVLGIEETYHCLPMAEL